MAIAPAKPKTLTYEDYLCDVEENLRYDILDGEKVYMPSPSILHQILSKNLFLLFDRWNALNERGLVLYAPCDILIRLSPLQTRQPDILFITWERLGRRRLDDPAPLSPAPEIVVEILSSGNSAKELLEKIADYGKAGVVECWLVDVVSRSIEVLGLSLEGSERIALYTEGENAHSAAFPTLDVSVDDVFRY